MALSVRIAPTIVVLLRAPADPRSSNAMFFLSCYCNGQEIGRCGSGTLAAARALLTQGDADIRAPIAFNTVRGPVQVVVEGLELGYRISPLPYFPHRNRTRWATLLNREPREIVLVGNANDYCLLELAHQAALDQCSVNARRLALASRRALIVTAKSSDARFDYALRYFSPQYGQYEDSATGSAHAMVANYWQSRLGKSVVSGVQRSARGGEFTVKRSGLAQCVFGRAELE